MVYFLISKTMSRADTSNQVILKPGSLLLPYFISFTTATYKKMTYHHIYLYIHTIIIYLYMAPKRGP